VRAPVRRQISSLVVLASALAGCGAEHDHYAPAGSSNAGQSLDAKDSGARLTPGGVTHGTSNVAKLVLSTRTSVESYLARVHAVVRDARGNVIAGAEEESSTTLGVVPAELELELPAGDDYSLSLDASTTDAMPTTCHAEVASLSVAADSRARLQVFSWQCGDETGYVPTTPDADCYWLADWLFVSRTSAPVGEPINVAAAGHDLAGQSVKFDWSASDAGRFMAPREARTTFVCDASAEALPLTVQLDGGDCRQALSQTVSCW
jgi:hypothetical protein